MEREKTGFCPICGKEFEKVSYNQITCGEVCRLERDRRKKEADKQWAEPLPPELNLKIKDILNIMQNENIAYSQYAHNNESRRKYIEKYKEVQNNGIV